MDGKLKTCDFTQFGHNHVCPSGSQRRSQPGKKQPRRLTDLSLESSQKSQLVTFDWVQSWLAVLQSVDMKLRSLKVNLAPAQFDCLTHPQTVAITGQHQGVISHRSRRPFGSYNEPIYLIRSEIFSWASLKIGLSGHVFRFCWGTGLGWAGQKSIAVSSLSRPSSKAG